MKNTKFYPTLWQPLPYELFDNNWKYKQAKVKSTELILKNDDILEKGISEMTIEVTKLAFIDATGQEHQISDFTNQQLQLKGDHTGLFITSKNALMLKEGRYKTIRFYLNGKIDEAVYVDRSCETIHNVNYLDFQIENGLNVSSDFSCQVILRFQLNPNKWWSYFYPIKDFFEKHLIKTKRMANSFYS
ncbi:hypothetical protein ACU8DI_02040 [Psychroserpens sp. BH13MA-6]